MPALYDHPSYYEIAFSFRSIPNEVDLFEECFRRFSKIPVKTVLELGCGNSPHMEELAKRGYRYTGFDLNPAMLEYSRDKAKRLGIETTLIEGDMRDFNLGSPADFVYIMLGSLYVANTEELKSHFDSVARALKKGGLYLMDWCLHTAPSPAVQDSWEEERDGIRVKTTFLSNPVSLIEQTFEDTIVLEVDDHGNKLTLTQQGIKRAIYPQEFLTFINGRQDFEFVGWWNDWDLDQPLEKAKDTSRPVALVRRT